jgi:cell division protein FtsB
MRETPAPPRAPRPFLAFFVSLAASSAVLAILLLWDHRVLELKNARTEVRDLDRQIAERTRENEELRVQIEAANRHQFPAEKVAREELHLVRADDLVLLYPPGALTAPERKGPEKKTRHR